MSPLYLWILTDGVVGSICRPLHTEGQLSSYHVCTVVKGQFTSLT